MYKKPLKITSTKLEKIINEYFEYCDVTCKTPLYPELLIKCDLLRETWEDYRSWDEDIDKQRYENDENYRERINERIKIKALCKKAELRLESSMSNLAINGKNTGAIFLLKQKPYGGYTDKQVTEIGGTDVPISITIKGADGKEFK